MLGTAEHLRVIEHAPARTIEKQQSADIAHRQTPVRQLDQRIVEVTAAEFLGVVHQHQR